MTATKVVYDSVEMGNTTLPIPTSLQRDVLERSGVVFHHQSHLHNGLLNVSLPEGWKKVQKSRCLFDLLDEHDRKRAYIMCEFNENTFGGAEAYMGLRTRYGILDCDDEEIFSLVGDCGNIVFISSRFPLRTSHISARGSARDEAFIWLTEHFPDWEKPSAYWE